MTSYYLKIVICQFMSHDLGRDHIVVGFTTTSAISVYDH